MKKENKENEYWLPKYNAEFYQTKEYKRFVKLCEDARICQKYRRELLLEVELSLLSDYEKYNKTLPSN